MLYSEKQSLYNKDNYGQIADLTRSRTLFSVYLYILYLFFFFPLQFLGSLMCSKTHAHISDLVKQKKFKDSSIFKENWLSSAP